MKDSQAENQAEHWQAENEARPDIVDRSSLAHLVEKSQASQPPSPASASFRASPAKAPKSRVPLLSILIVAELVVALVLGSYLYKGMLKESAAGPHNPTDTPDMKLPPLPSGKADLIAVPGGTLQMGRADGAPQEGPPHSVTVGSFYMDRTEVTNAEYAEFIREIGYPAPSHFVDGKPVKGQELWPVTNVSLGDANAFAVWRTIRDGVTYRLPTEEEWEFAARDGGQGTTFPWGDEWSDGKANIGTASLKPVGSSPQDKTRAGIVDMIGNAYEFTSSKASYYQGNERQIKSEHAGWIVIRGGAYTTDMTKKRVSATYRDWIPPTLKNFGLGFRLVYAAR